ncbi:nitrogen assimilation transcription factor nit-4 [Ceratobasidium sp. AG-Ba]|nr:nitrogen assimilation transcription factor nit-4 [Ceratobasidium sp. AG-Ba]
MEPAHDVTIGELHHSLELVTDAGVDEESAMEITPSVDFAQCGAYRLRSSRLKSKAVTDNPSKCSWSNEDDSWRPPKKQYVEALLVKIQTLELECAQMKAEGKETLDARGTAAINDAGPSSNRADLVPPRDLAPGIESNSWHALGAKRMPKNPDVEEDEKMGYDLENIYQFIFNIDSSAPILSQSVRQIVSCEWNRYLPSLGDVHFTRLEHDTIVDRYLKYANTWFMCIVPRLFLCDMLYALSCSEDTPVTGFYSPMLHCSLLAFASAFSDDPWIRRPETRRIFAQHAKLFLDKELGRPSICLVQSLVLLSEYHNGLGELEQGYIYFGMGARALSARSSRLVPPGFGHIDRGIVEHWCYWSVYSRDKIMVSTIDLSTLFEMNLLKALETDCDYILRSLDRKLELPCTESIFCSYLWLGQQNSMIPAGLVGDTRLGDVFLESCKLMYILESILCLHYPRTLDAKLVPDNLALEIHSDLETWMNELPSGLSISSSSNPLMFPHVVVLNIAYWWIVLRFHQPFYWSEAKKGECRPFDDLSNTLCDGAAREIMVLVELYRRWHGLRLFPCNMVQIYQAIYDAGVLFLEQVTSRSTDPGSNPKTTGDISECMIALHEIGETWECAKGYLAQLQVLASQRAATPHAFSH